MKVLLLLTLIVLFSSLFVILPHANAQQSTRKILQDLQAEGRSNCEVWQINNFLYKPVRINIVHQPVDNHKVSISTEGGGEAFWDGSKETFQLVAKDTDRYTAEIVLDYEFKHDEPRQVFYQVFAQDRILVMEGNWVHEGFTFCKIIDFWIEEAPTELTPEEIVEINNQFNSEFRKEVAQQNTTVETGLLVVAIIIAVIGILSTTYFIIIIISQRSMARVSKKPAKKLQDMIESVRKLADVMRLQTKYNMTTDKDMKEKLIQKVDNSLRDLAIMTAGTQQKIELVASFPKPESLVPKGGEPVSDIPPVKGEKIDEEQQRKNEDVYAEEYGLKSIEMAKPEVSFVDLVLQNEDEQRKEPISNETDKETKTDEEPKSIEDSVKDLKPCVYCGKKPDYICKDCKKMFCKEHESHNCKGKETKNLGVSDLISTLTQKIIKSVMEKKDSITNSDEEMDSLFEKGYTKSEVKDMLIKEYLKIPYKEAREIYDKIHKDYAKKKTFPNSLRIEAMMERLVRSDT